MIRTGWGNSFSDIPFDHLCRPCSCTLDNFDAPYAPATFTPSISTCLLQTSDHHKTGLRCVDLTNDSFVPGTQPLHVYQRVAFEVIDEVEVSGEETAYDLDPEVEELVDYMRNLQRHR